MKSVYLRVLPLLTNILGYCATSASGVRLRNHGVADRDDDGQFQLFLEKTADTVPAKLGNGTFKQLIDHSNAGLGTFSQLYYWSTEYYGGPGYPIILNTPGESNATEYTSYLSLNRTTGVIAQRLKAAVVLLEHRYWGFSSPFPELTTKTLQHLTIENAIQDLTNVAENLRPSWDPQGLSRASKAPWILVGGSYAGALTAYTAQSKPGVFWAYYASSASVQATGDFWNWFSPVQKGMPKNCSADVNLVLDHLDSIFRNGTRKQMEDMKASFGFPGLTVDDFAAAIENGPWAWQALQFYPGHTSFFDFCDMIENADVGLKPGPGGVGLEKALAGYIRWSKQKLIPGNCKSYGYPEWSERNSVGCFVTYNHTSPQYTVRSVSNKFELQWQWMLCNEPLGFWQNGAPPGQKTLASRTVTNAYWHRQCGYYFPEEGIYSYGYAKGLTESQTNARLKGWNITAKRLLYVNGELDPWLYATVSSPIRPGGPLKSTPDTPVIVLPGGYHASDLVTKNAIANPGANRTVQQVVKTIVDWVNEHPSRQRLDK